MRKSSDKNRKRARNVKPDRDLRYESFTEADNKKLNRLSARKRKLTIHGTKALFRAIDVLFNNAQNSCPYINKDNIDTIECQKDIVYYDILKSICTFDFYSCKTDKKMPAIILIHGGGFSAGDKKYRMGRSQFFAVNGFAVFCINYGLAPDFKFPDPLVHIVTAANYIYDHADEYNIDKDKIIVDGDSAGAYYAAMLASFNGNKQLGEILGCAPKFKIFGALFNCGVYNMNTVLNTKYPLNLANGVVLSMTGISVDEFESYEYKSVCEPINLVTPEFPPTFVVYSDHDVFCKGQGGEMVEKLRENGVYCESYSARHRASNHCFSLTWRGEDATVANELTISFVKRLAECKINL